jgi:hypothetical protein
MRLYLKFLAMLTLFMGTAALAAPAWHAVAEAADDVRIALVYEFGSPAAVENLIEGIQCDHARRCGSLEYHTKTKRYQRLLNDRLAEAVAGRDTPIGDDEYCRIQAACALEVFGVADVTSAVATADRSGRDGSIVSEHIPL